MAGAVKIAILANARGAIKEINDTARATEGLGTNAKSAGGRMKKLIGGAAVAAGVAVVGDALRDGVKEAGAFQDAGKQTTAALKSNKNLHGVTAAQVQKSSAALESLTGAKIDENDATLAANKLIRSGVTSQAGLDRALKTSADVALGSGKDIGGVSQALSKALANPAKAAGVLGKAGVVLSKSQQDAITAMAATGDTAGAQSLIMDALEGKYKGASEAAGTGLTADLGRAQDAMADAKRDVATALMPALSTLATTFAQHLPGAIAKVVPVFNTLVALVQNPAFLALAAAIGAIVVGMKAYSAITTVVSAATKVWAAIQAAFNFVMALNPVALIVIGIVLLIAAIVWIATKTTWFQTIWTAVWTAVKAVALFIWDGIKAYFALVFAVIKGIFSGFMAAVKAIWGGITWLWDKAVAIFNAIKGAIGTAVDWVKEKIRLFIEGVKIVWARIMTLVDKAVAFKDRIIGVFKDWWDWMVALPGKIIKGLVDGLKAGWTKVTDFFKGAIDLIPDGIKSALGIGSPSKVMAGIGANIGKGLAVGVKSQLPALGKIMDTVSGVVAGGVTADARVKLRADAVVSSGGGSAAAAPITINVSVATGVDPAEVGRQTIAAIEAYQRRVGRQRLLPV